MALRVPQRAPVSEVDDLWIPLPDGGRLSAHLWLPPGADAAPVPAIVEVSPYRHEDHTRRRDAVRHPYFAEHGYASLRVDIRGSGASSGVLLDEYTEQEQEDVCAALEWVAAQTWCTGSLGMIGLSWGGFAALQAAARRPAALKAVVALCASADRYGADVKYHGGCVLGCELLPWSSTMLAMSVRPPDPDLVGEGWRELWLERLEQAVPFAETWLAHQRRDEYWHTGSPSDDYASVECPVYAVGGWADPYRQAVLDLLASLSGPRKGLIGPWSHQLSGGRDSRPGLRLSRRVRPLVGSLAQGRADRRHGRADAPRLDARAGGGRRVGRALGLGGDVAPASGRLRATMRSATARSRSHLRPSARSSCPRPRARDWMPAAGVRGRTRTSRATRAATTTSRSPSRASRSRSASRSSARRL